MVLAVLQQHCGIRLHAHDVFVSTVGGARLSEPASDLAIAVALASANAGTPAPAGVVAMGEIGLAGELRRVRDLPQRLAEAGRLGFRAAVVPGRPDASGPARRRDRARSTACRSSTRPTSPPRCGCSGSATRRRATLRATDL